MTPTKPTFPLHLFALAFVFSIMSTLPGHQWIHAVHLFS